MPTPYLLDTNVLSETVRSRPDPRVMAWLDSLETEQMFVSVLTLAEIRKGALMVADAQRTQTLMQWLDEVLPPWFDDRILSLDVGVSTQWATLLAAAAHQKLSAIDSLLAATAVHHGLTIATRNGKDFKRMNVPIFNPWDFRG